MVTVPEKERGLGIRILAGIERDMRLRRCLRSGERETDDDGSRQHSRTSILTLDGAREAYAGLQAVAVALRGEESRFEVVRAPQRVSRSAKQAKSWRLVQTRRPFPHSSNSSVKREDHCLPNNTSPFLFDSLPSCRLLPRAEMFKMRWFLSFLLLCFSGAVHALSTSGNRLLVVLEEAAEKDAYSTFWSDLEGQLLLLETA